MTNILKHRNDGVFLFRNTKVTENASKSTAVFCAFAALRETVASYGGFDKLNHRNVGLLSFRTSWNDSVYVSGAKHGGFDRLNNHVLVD
ncbi:MAG: hypothetical protein SFU91_13525 [Chloroherpetonaceae bacterium]|nr:hypothetical protein [Chloroherpetonaceae bacterium]